ncbi:hypothetical protein ACG02S_00195 [Roseateles sp. DC23W]|uniref:Ig-like domain (Group 2) n=1 Tax=Pelomonas dachongensis TaxID=3299029 RepID=A0ABW7EGJ4_9BURK
MNARPSSLPARLLGAFSLALCLGVAGCGGGGDGGATPAAVTPSVRTDDPAAVTRLQWATAAPLFTASGQQQPLQVQALGAQGQVLNVPVTWQSSAPAVVGVAAPAAGTTGEAATLTSVAATGTAVVTATVGSRSLSAVAVVAGAAPGTVVLNDAQVIGLPQATDPAAPLRVGSTYTVTLAPDVAPPAVGQRVLGRGSQAIAGEVMAVNGRVLTLALVPLRQLLPQLQLDLDLPLQAAPARVRTAAAGPAGMRALAAGRVRPLAETSFSVPGFDCDAEGSAGGVELAKKEVTPTGMDSLRYRVLWNDQRQMLRLSGQPGVQFELEPTAKLAFTGKLDCKLELADIPIPLPPAIGLFLGVGFPVGVGFTLEGALPINGVALNLKGQAQADVVVGFDCNPGCASLNSLQTSGSVTPNVVAPEFTANRLELSGQVYAWANFEGGARWSSTLQFDAIEAQAGLKFATILGTENAQAKDAASAGQYALSFEASVAPTEALGDFAALVGLILEQAKLETSVPMGRSPTATLTIDKARFKALDDVKFTVDLTAAEVLFPLQGYNVQAVRVYRKTTAADGSFVLVLAGEQAASNGQTQFVIPWLATVDGGSDISFVAFVQTRLLSGQRWQVGLAASEAPTVPANAWGGQLTLQYTFSVQWSYDHSEECGNTLGDRGTCNGKGAGTETGSVTHVLAAQTNGAVARGGAGAPLTLTHVSASGSLTGQTSGSYISPLGNCTIATTGAHRLDGVPTAARMRRPWMLTLGGDDRLGLSTASTLSSPSAIDTTFRTQLLGNAVETRSSGCPGGASSRSFGDGEENRTYYLIPSIFSQAVDGAAPVWQGTGTQTFTGTGAQCENVRGVTAVLLRRGSVTCSATLTATWNLERR